MILIALAALCVVTVPLTGGRLGRLAEVRLRGAWTPIAALTLQVMIVTVAPGGSPTLHKALHILTYVMLALFLVLNRRLPGLAIVGAGAFLNALVIVLNGGQMPASATAQRIAGLHAGTGFQNSAALAHPVLPWLGDVIPWPGPLHNVLSVGDCLIYAGMAIAVHRLARRPESGTRALPQPLPQLGD